MPALDYLSALNPAQRRAAEHGVGDDTAGPLLIIAGAGSGKTRTLAHRVVRRRRSGLARCCANQKSPLERSIFLVFCFARSGVSQGLIQSRRKSERAK